MDPTFQEKGIFANLKVQSQKGFKGVQRQTLETFENLVPWPQTGALARRGVEYSKRQKHISQSRQIPRHTWVFVCLFQTEPLLILERFPGETKRTPTISGVR